jgi:hypothetical protein
LDNHLKKLILDQFPGDLQVVLNRGQNLIFIPNPNGRSLESANLITAHQEKNARGLGMSEEKVLSFGIITILLSVVALSFVKASSVETVQVGALSEEMVTFNLDSGQKFTGSLSISGGGNDIDFWVTDPQGTKVVDLGRVTQGKTFEFTAEASGAYTLHFSNTFSWFTGKTVYLTYDVGSPTVSGIDVGFLLIIIGAVAIILILLVALGVALHRRKNIPKTNQQQPPQPPQPPPPPSKSQGQTS